MQSLLLNNMSSDLLIPKQKLDYLIRSAPYRYKVFKIKKQSGAGYRTIAQPAREIKTLQYWILKNIFPVLSVHECATAYVKNSNIYKNAYIHSCNSYFLKTDFENFFNSIGENDLNIFFKTNNKWKYADIDIEKLCKMLLWKPKKNDKPILSIGAPTSPFLSNAIMFEFDCKISKYCKNNDIIYTRYADDIVFSMNTKEKRSETYRALKTILDDMIYPNLKINEKKTVFGSKANKRLITGLIITNDGDVSLGRDRKRNISSKIHHLVFGGLSEEEKPKLKGLLAFSKDVEPSFIDRMKKKYGDNFMDLLD